MFYRLKFDGYVGRIFERAGYDANASMDLWPVGRTQEWAQKRKELRLKPVEAAAVSIADLALARVTNGTMTLDEARYLVYTRLTWRREKGVAKRFTKY
ncbi:hypothetical protein MJD09_17625 [bacterium]|nr:hypothetical protein [bacterium]